MKNFLVYKSSAGSGKTTTLVKEYLKLTLTNPSLFSHVLAITFTNKAAHEMKTRIVDTLREIVAGHTHEELINNVLKETGLTQEQSKQNAKQLLFFIDHHYDDFSVSTIDSFVHKIIRTFAGDLSLPQNFEVVLDKDDIVPFIVEDIYKKMGIDAGFTKIVTHFVTTQIEDEKSYNISGMLSDFVENQMKEENFFASEFLENLQTHDFIELIKNLNVHRFQLRKEIEALGKSALARIAKQGLEHDDFSYKKTNGALSFFKKITTKIGDVELANPKHNSRIYKAFEEDTGWYGKNANATIVEKIEAVKPFLKQTYQQLKPLLKAYFRRELIFKNIYQVALIHEIGSLFKQFIVETQKVHISEFNKRIAMELAGQPVPWLYERLGHRYTHFMIDEFQDTSVLQWNNLLPLIEESLANNRFNLIVGDAKQAIYRFRGGEVELFTQLPKLLHSNENQEIRLREQVLTQNYEYKNLDTNYRSRNNIIDFNNRFFEIAKRELSDDFRAIYQHHEQKTAPLGKEGGLISFRFIQSKVADEFRTAKLEEVTNIIGELKANGYPWEKIAVLSLKNRDASAIASHLLQQGIPIVSSESVKLSSSIRVRFLVAYLHYLTHPEDAINRIDLSRLFLLLQNSEAHFYAVSKKMVDKKYRFNDLIQTYGFAPLSLDSLSKNTVYELCEALIRHFFVKEPLDIFVRFFLDFVFDKQPIHQGDIGRFLKLWEEKSEKLSISLPENINAVQIMTAHKAKGLKFGVVIADLEYYKAKKTKEQFWDAPEVEELSPIENTLFDINKNLDAIDKLAVYEREMGKSKLDFLNLMYVAFTRPVDALYALGDINEEGKGKFFSTYLINYLEANTLWNKEQLTYQFGKLPPVSKEEKTTESSERRLTFVPSIAWNNHVQIAAPDNPLALSNQTLSEKLYGTLLHDILAEIQYAEDLPKVLTAFEQRALLDKADRPFIEQTLRNLLSCREIASAFNRNAVIKTETEIYDAESGKLLRPDRVVLLNNQLTIIDYKTGKKEEKHTKQIQAYGLAFSKMGYKVTRLQLVYIGENIEVVEVNRLQ